ncbi:MAG: flagellar biosynthesis anti-sigma factor FlgM [Acidobacteria bacterium]|nr:flagellar biosynthesis anti-sigma factor FlgM [Acidobacteriota bacterium]
MEVRNHFSPTEVASGSQTAAASQAQLKESTSLGSSSSAGMGVDSTTLSSVGSLAAGAMAVSDVRMEKVQAVQQALADGTYSVSPEQIAGKLIDHMQGK